MQNEMLRIPIKDDLSPRGGKRGGPALPHELTELQLKTGARKALPPFSDSDVFSAGKPFSIRLFLWSQVPEFVISELRLCNSCTVTLILLTRVWYFELKP